MEEKSQRFPDGITKRHLSSAFITRHVNWIALLLLGATLAMALTGVFGGAPSKQHRVSADGATFSIDSAEILRNGQIFEMRITVAALSDIIAPRIALDNTYWRDVTINTIRPEPASQSFSDGHLLLAYDRLPQGETLAITIDGQVNPVLGHYARTSAELLDGDKVLAVLPLVLTVLP